MSMPPRFLSITNIYGDGQSQTWAEEGRYTSIEGRLSVEKWTTKVPHTLSLVSDKNRMKLVLIEVDNLCAGLIKS